MNKAQKQKPRKVRNEAMGEAFRELRQGSRTSPHKNRAKYDRNDYRKSYQRGDY